MKKTGTILILSSLAIWIALLFGNSFKLTQSSFENTVSETHQELLKPKLVPLFDQEFGSTFSFATKIKTAIAEVNNELNASGNGGSKIYDSYELSLTKAAGVGFVSRNKSALFWLIFGLLVIGSMLFILPDA
ncbi:MAG: Fe2+ transport system protein B, partial [Arcticibacterium sp.]